MPITFLIPIAAKQAEDRYRKKIPHSKLLSKGRILLRYCSRPPEGWRDLPREYPGQAPTKMLENHCPIWIITNLNTTMMPLPWDRVWIAEMRCFTKISLKVPSTGMVTSWIIWRAARIRVKCCKRTTWILSMLTNNSNRVTLPRAPTTVTKRMTQSSLETSRREALLRCNIKATLTSLSMSMRSRLAVAGPRLLKSSLKKISGKWVKTRLCNPLHLLFPMTTKAMRSPRRKSF